MRSSDKELRDLLAKHSRKRKKEILGIALSPEVIFMGHIIKVTDTLAVINQLDEIGGKLGKIIIRVEDIHHIVEDSMDFVRDQLEFMATMVPLHYKDEDDDFDFMGG